MYRNIEIPGYSAAKAQNSQSNFVNLILILVYLQFCYALSLHHCESCLDVIVKVCVTKILEISRVYYGV
jgi:hypothetical protein